MNEEDPHYSELRRNLALRRYAISMIKFGTNGLRLLSEEENKLETVERGVVFDFAVLNILEQLSVASVLVPFNAENWGNCGLISLTPIQNVE